jgi:flagellar protein FliS
MQSSARENYLVTDVMTATPQKLHLMLIEAAIRSAERARDKWQTGEDARASEALIHAHEVVGELLAGLNRDIDAGLARKVAAVYLFVSRSLMEANCQRDDKKLQDALRVLEVERETWRQVCQRSASAYPCGRKASDDPPADQPSVGARCPASGHSAAVRVSGQGAVAGPPGAGRPLLAEVSPGSGAVDDSVGTGLSLEA